MTILTNAKDDKTIRVGKLSFDFPDMSYFDLSS